MPTKKISELDERLNLYSEPSGPYSAIPSPVSATDSEYLFMIARSGVTNQKIDYKNLKSSVLDNAVFLTGAQLISGNKVFQDTCTFLSRIYINEIIDITQTGDINGHIFIGESGLFENIGVGNNFFTRASSPQHTLSISGSSLFDGNITITGALKRAGDRHEFIGNSYHQGELRITGDSNQEGDMSLQGDRDILGDINQKGNADFQSQLGVSGNIGLGEYLYHNEQPAKDTSLRFTNNSIELKAGDEASIEITDNFISFDTNSSEAVKITNEGKFVVGTETPHNDAELAVSGDSFLERLKIWDGINWVDIPGEDDETMIFKTRLFAGQDSYQIDFPKDFVEVPIIASSIQNDNGGAVIPFQTSGVTRYNYQINFGTAIPDNHYSVHTAVMSTGEKARNKIGIQRFTTNLAAGQSSYKIDFPSTFAGTPVVTPTIDGGNAIVPFSISGVSASHYYISFLSTTTQDYKVNTISTLPGRKHLAKGA